MTKHDSDVIQRIKQCYEPEGFVILGVFGSFARGEETGESDIDILYACTDTAYEKYPGWEFFRLYEQVKHDLEQALGRKVDLADRDGLHDTAKKYILPEVVDVTAI